MCLQCVAECKLFGTFLGMKRNTQHKKTPKRIYNQTNHRLDSIKAEKAKAFASTRGLSMSQLLGYAVDLSLAHWKKHGFTIPAKS
jgi:hypothetical protein